jgi:hypothetical protein
MTLTSPSTASSPRTTELRPWLLASTLALVVALWTVAAVPAARAAATTGTAKLSLTGVVVKTTTGDAKITVTGRVKLRINTANERKRTEVLLTLSGATGKPESFTSKLTSKDSFTVALTTKLSGALGLDAVVKIDGRQSGKRIVRTLSVAAPASPSGGTGASTSQSASSTSGAGTPGSSSSTPGSSSVPGTELNGTFEIEPGAEHPDGLLSGTYFRMQSVGNANSPFADKEYTPLSPGADGGLETFAYQEPPVPAFADGDVGGALANAIVQPQDFFEVNFSIVTAPTDPQEGLPDPLPQIVDTNGQLSGQITAWDAQWNGSSFNQGAPKANGTLAADGRGSTTLPTGTYDAATGHYVLTWTSVIIGGAFGGFIGEWHLEGTFVPEA